MLQNEWIDLKRSLSVLGLRVIKDVNFTRLIYTKKDEPFFPASIYVSMKKDFVTP